MNTHSFIPVREEKFLFYYGFIRAMIEYQKDEVGSQKSEDRERE
jgi:hypothetical protein